MCDKKSLFEKLNDVLLLYAFQAIDAKDSPVHLISLVLAINRIYVFIEHIEYMQLAVERNL